MTNDVSSGKLAVTDFWSVSNSELYAFCALFKCYSDSLVTKTQSCDFDRYDVSSCFDKRTATAAWRSLLQRMGFVR